MVSSIPNSPVGPTSSAETELGNVKGAAVRAFLIWYHDQFGPDRVEALLKHVPESVKSSFDVDKPDLGILASGWYSTEFIHAYCDALTRVHDRMELDKILRKGVVATMEKNLQSVYKRFFLRVLMSPDRYVKYCQSLWGMHFDNGTLDVRVEGRCALRWTIHDWRSHHRILCQMVTFSEPSVFGAMGCKRVTSVEKGCVTLGDDRCEHVIRWSNAASIPP